MEGSNKRKKPAAKADKKWRVQMKIYMKKSFFEFISFYVLKYMFEWICLQNECA